MKLGVIMFRILFSRKEAYFDYSRCSKDLDACTKRINALRDQALHKNPAVRNKVNATDLAEVQQNFKRINKELRAFQITDAFKEQIEKIEKLFVSAKAIPKYKDVVEKEEELEKFSYLKTDEIAKNLISCLSLLDKATKKIQGQKMYIHWLNPPAKDLKEAKEIQEKLTQRISSFPPAVTKRDDARYQELAELCQKLPGAKTKDALADQIKASQWEAARGTCEVLSQNHKSAESQTKIAQMVSALPDAASDGQELTIACKLVPEATTTLLGKVQAAFKTFYNTVQDAIGNRKDQISAYGLVPSDQKKIPNIEKEIVVLQGMSIS